MSGGAAQETGIDDAAFTPGVVPVFVGCRRVIGVHVSVVFLDCLVEERTVSVRVHALDAQPGFFERGALIAG